MAQLSEATASPRESWRPTATRERLALRARLLGEARAFFAERSVLEVETPALVNRAVSDVHIDSACVDLPGFAGRRFFLHSSPEYAMKRLIAAGCGDVYQVCRVFRGGERGRLHNPEFTMIEWYRIGMSLETLMREVAALVRRLLGSPDLPLEEIAYARVFERALGLDPLSAETAELRAAAASLGLARRSLEELSRDETLDLLMGARVGPGLGRASLSFVHRYPASQAALARLDPEDRRVALRFELYHEGIELANGFEELASAAEQRARFERDLEERGRRGLPAVQLDERFLAALEAGMPACSGVALGFDRLAMLAAGCERLDEVLAFPIERA